MEAVTSRYLQYADWKGAQLSIANPLLALHFSPNTGLLDKIDDLEHHTQLTASQKVSHAHTSHTAHRTPHSARTRALPESTETRAQRGSPSRSPHRC